MAVHWVDVVTVEGLSVMRKPLHRRLQPEELPRENISAAKSRLPQFVIAKMAKTLIQSVEIPTIALLYKLGRLQPSSPASTPASTNTPNQSYNNKIAYIRNDITVLHLDAIVNAANRTLFGGGGIDGAIHKAAGPGLLKECCTLRGCKTGSAKITDAYNLPCKEVIHAVGPRYTDYEEPEARALLQGCYRTCLELAVENGLRSIALSCLSAGIYGYPTEAAAETALGAVRKFLGSGKGESLEKIVFCVFMEKDEEAYDMLIPYVVPQTLKTARRNTRRSSLV